MNKRSKCVLFDCDGVLVDSEPALAEIAAQILQREGIPAKAEDFIPYIGTGEDTYIGKVMEKYGVDYYPEIKMDIYNLYIETAKEKVKSFPGCLDLLDKLKKSNIKMAVASSADKIKVDANLEALGFKRFDAVISGSDVKRKKPWPDIYLLAAEQVGVSPKACIVVEDAVSGIKSGKAADMITIGFTSACSRDELLAAGADFVVDDFFQMEEVLNKLLKK